MRDRDRTRSDKELGFGLESALENTASNGKEMHGGSGAALGCANSLVGSASATSSPEGTPAACPAPAPAVYDSDVAVDSLMPQEADKDELRLPKPFLEIDTGDADTSVDLVMPDRKVSFDITSPLSCKSTGSSCEFKQPNQTIIIFDWDDTLCPSTTCMRTHGLSVLGAPPEGELMESLEELASEVKLLLEQASELAEKVVIVTNAEEGWVELSCKAWLPSLLSTLAACEVASARSTWEPRGVQSPAGWKAKTFEDVIDRFYSRYQHQSWKNIISVGDAPHEREALARVVRYAPSRGKRCRSKSVKFVLRPTVEQLTRELQMLRESLKEIVLHDDDLDLHFSAESLSEPLIATPSATPNSQQGYKAAE